MHHKQIIRTIVLILLVLGAIGLIGIQQRPQKTVNTILSTNVVPKNEPTLVLLYTQQLSQVQTVDRTWPTVAITRKIGNNAPEVLANVGKVGEFPEQFVVSPSKKLLLVNLGSKLQILNLDTKELRDVFLPKKQVLSGTFSPDEKRIFIWDQEYGAGTDLTYYAHVLTMETKLDQIVLQGTSNVPYMSAAWRPDNSILLFRAGSESAPLYQIPLSRPELLPLNVGLGKLTTDGTLLAVEKTFVPDICDVFSGRSPNAYTVIDPVAKKEVVKIRSEKGSIGLILFSPKNDALVYGTLPPVLRQEDCGAGALTWYQVRFATNEVTPVASLKSLLSGWRADALPLAVRFNQGDTYWTIDEDQVSLVASVQGLRLIGGYYR